MILPTLLARRSEIICSIKGLPFMGSRALEVPIRRDSPAERIIAAIIIFWNHALRSRAAILESVRRPVLDLRAAQASRLLKKTHMPTACFKQAFMKVALDRPGKFSRSEQSRSNVPPKYASARLFFARLASEIFLTSPQTAFFNNLLGKHILNWR